MTEFIEKIGKASMNATATFRDILFFAFTILARIFQKKTYNSAMKMVLVNQIYFTSVQILPLFTVLSIILGSLLIGIVLQIIKNLGLAEYLGRILMGLVVTEISPFVTVLLVALRSSSAMNAEIAVMKVNKELRTLDTYNIDVIDYLFVPRIINGVVSVLLLSALFSILALTSGMIFSKLIFGMSFDVYTNVLLKSADIYDIDIYLIKCCIFGFFITLIPIRSGLSASDDLTSIPIAVLQGMVKVFIAIIFIEVLSLILISL
ncbi:MAG TPA: ABC transporter permease [Syntrophaceae bacterium]|nr:ABC transporter permease [Syntrophaceae bacterium]